MATQRQGHSEEAEIMLSALSALVEPLAALFPAECEVVLHDLSKLPNSIVAIAGDLTARKVGGPATDLLLKAGAQDSFSTSLGYESRQPDGRLMRGSTIICRDSTGRAVAALCINNDTTRWRAMEEVARSMLPWTKRSPNVDLANEADVTIEEELLRDVDELAQRVLSQAITSVGIPVELMHKRHKMAVVSDLKDRGFFLLKASVETAAQALGVTRFTVYNYLNALDQDGESDDLA